MKLVFVVSQVLFVGNLLLFFVLPAVFRLVVALFPNLDSADNGLAFYPLIGFVGLIITGPLAFITSVAYAWYKNRKQG